MTESADKADYDALVEALAKALCDADPTSVTDATWRVVREEHREYRRQHARTLMSLGLRLPVCGLCGDVLVRHEGNGGQWLGAVPPRDWMTCHGSVDGSRHEPSTSPAPTNQEGGR